MLLTYSQSTVRGLLHASVGGRTVGIEINLSPCNQNNAGVIDRIDKIAVFR